MRPLSPQEAITASGKARRLWRRVWLLLFSYYLPSCAIAAWAAYEIVSLGAMILMVALSAVPYIVIAVEQRRWHGDLSEDLAEGVVAEKSGRIYDRFRLLPWRRYNLFVEGVQVPIELSLDARELAGLGIGDTVAVEYLPRTGLVLWLKKGTAS